MTISLKHLSLLVLSLFAFAANSVLCRLALSDHASGALATPASFTFWRLLSGAITLMVFCLLSMQKDRHQKRQSPNSLTKKSTWSSIHTMWQEGDWLSASALFVYAGGFSLAYVSLSTGVGALILFGAVQLTLIVLTIKVGHRLAYQEWLGLTVAFAGFVYLVFPTLSTPSLTGFVIMLLAGVAWGLYTWRGKYVRFSLYATASNFIRALLILIIAGGMVVVAVPEADIFASGETTFEGFFLAILSGAVMSGVGYALWYTVLPHIQSAQAAVLQLLVPIIAAIGGVLFADEMITSHLVLASAGVLGGVLLMTLTKRAS